MENLGGWDQSEDHPDFDPNLLANVDSWAVDHVDDHTNHGPVHEIETANLQMHEHHRNSENVQRKSRSHSNQWTNFDAIPVPTDFDDEAAVEAAVAAISEPSNSSTPGGDRSDLPSKERITQHHLHPLGMQSSADCPEHFITTNVHNNFNHSSTQYSNKYSAHPALSAIPLPISQQHEHQRLCSADLSKALERSLAAPTTGAINQQHMSSLAANFMLAQSGHPSLTATTTAAASIASDSAPAVTITTNSTASVSSKVKNQSKKNKKRQTPKKKKSDTSTTSATVVSSSSSSAALPPFYLFDAPVELRANFMQNQRRLGLPIENDPNSFHFGETVNGFHPHQYQHPAGAGDTAAAGGTTTISVTSGGGRLGSSKNNAPPTGSISNTTKHVPKLIDARHGNLNRKNRGGQVKNEREQKRAQKITDLIEQLRLQIVEGGWQVEARSKFHTLYNCSEYVKHMIAHTSEKEKENEKLQLDLDEKRRRIEREKEEKAIMEGRSDPESVMSSLTADTTLSCSRHKEAEQRNTGSNTNDSNKKRKLSASNREEDSSRDNKKLCTASSEAATEDSSGEGRGGSSGSGSGSGGDPSAHGCSMSKTISTVSDITDSNRGSSSNNSGSGGVPTEQDNPSRNTDDEEQPSTSTISSDAAVASDKTSRDRHSCHKDVVFNNDERMGWKRPPEEVTSLERSFELNYEEVFNKSNIPQLIASTSGKIITWNGCFAKATGYRKNDIQRMTIFSLVKPENLASFFEIVAAALRPSDEDTDTSRVEDMTKEESKNNSFKTDSSEENLNNKEDCKMKIEEKEEAMKVTKEKNKHTLDYTAMTLPCIDFPAMRKRNQAANDSDSVSIPPLHVTVTLMSDKDPSKRCFHCVFTNSKGTNGSLGIITPELLSSLFAEPLRRRKKHLSSHHGHHVKQISNEKPERPPSPLNNPPPHGEVQMKEEDEY